VAISPEEGNWGGLALSGVPETLQHTKLQVTLSCEINNTELIAPEAPGERGTKLRGVGSWEMGHGE